MMKFRVALCFLLGFCSASHAQLEGMIDVHMHSAPDSMARSIDALETARNAKTAGMRAIVLKNHYTQTAGMAYLVSQVVPGLEIYGGIALNRALGGLNTAAIEHMVRTTGNLGRIVWMPTFDSEHYHLTGTPNPAFVAISANGQLLPETLAVLQSISVNNLALATGHSSPEESLMLIQAARAAGIDRIIVTHPVLPQVGMTLEQEQKAAELGAFLEYCIGFALNSDTVFMQFVEQIRQLGPEHVILSTDLGQPGNPSHAEGLRMFVERAKAAGITQAQLDIMLKTNPATLLGLQ
jgi:hypothetical protein